MDLSESHVKHDTVSKTDFEMCWYVRNGQSFNQSELSYPKLLENAQKILKK